VRAPFGVTGVGAREQARAVVDSCLLTFAPAPGAGACEHLQYVASHDGEEDVIGMQRSLELAMSTMIRCRRTEPGGYNPTLFAFFSDLESRDLLSIAKPLSVSALLKHMKRDTLMTNIPYIEAHDGVVRWACLSDFLAKGEGPHP